MTINSAQLPGGLTPADCNRIDIKARRLQAHRVAKFMRKAWAVLSAPFRGRHSGLATSAELSSLGEHMLNDIGLSRNDLARPMWVRLNLDEHVHEVMADRPVVKHTNYAA